MLKTDQQIRPRDGNDITPAYETIHRLKYRYATLRQQLCCQSSIALLKFSSYLMRLVFERCRHWHLRQLNGPSTFHISKLRSTMAIQSQANLSHVPPFSPPSYPSPRTCLPGGPDSMPAQPMQILYALFLRFCVFEIDAELHRNESHGIWPCESELEVFPLGVFAVLVGFRWLGTWSSHFKGEADDVVRRLLLGRGLLGLEVGGLGVKAVMVRSSGGSFVGMVVVLELIRYGR